MSQPLPRGFFVTGASDARESRRACRSRCGPRYKVALRGEHCRHSGEQGSAVPSRAACVRASRVMITTGRASRWLAHARTVPWADWQSTARDGLVNRVASGKDVNTRNHVLPGSESHTPKDGGVRENTQADFLRRTSLSRHHHRARRCREEISVQFAAAVDRVFTQTGDCVACCVGSRRSGFRGAIMLGIGLPGDLTGKVDQYACQLYLRALGGPYDARDRAGDQKRSKRTRCASLRSVHARNEAHLQQPSSSRRGEPEETNGG
jgi:hypothetical protein